MPGSRQARLVALQDQIGALTTRSRTATSVLSFGEPAIDGCFPRGGLPSGCWHEVMGAGLEDETAAAPAAFVARLIRPLLKSGAVVWVMRRDDLHAPGLAGLEFPTGRLIQVKARDEAEVLSVLEDALSTVGVVAAIGEAQAPDLRAGRRLQLACEKQGGFGVLLHRRPYGAAAGRARTTSGSSAFSRWRIAGAPSQPPPGELGLGSPRWRVELERCRGGRSGVWILDSPEADHGPHSFRLVSQLADHDLAAAELGVRRIG